MVSLRIALRYLFSKKSHSAVNIISLISTGGVAVATIAIVCVLSVFNGFRDLAENRLSVVDPELKITPLSGKVILNADSIAGRIARIPGIDTALATIDEQALAISGGRQMAVTMRGVPSGFNRVSRLKEAIIDGNYTLLDDSVDCALLSVGTAIRLATHPDALTPLALYVPRRLGRINPANPMSAFRSDSLAVAGVYELNESEKDASTLFVSLPTARDLLDYDNGEASDIEVSLEKGITTETAKKQISALIGDNFRIADRLEQEEKSFRMIAIEKWITFIMLAFILLIASFNVISTLSMLMIEKADNMKTLKALGARTSMIRAIFTWEGWLISTSGGLIGIITGVILCLLQQTFGFIKLAGNEAQLSVTVYPVRVEATDLLIVGLLVIATGLFISTITARFAPRR